MDEQKKPLAFVNPQKEPKHYVKRYLNEPDYKAWFHRNYPNYTIYDAIGITEKQFKSIVDDLDYLQSKQVEPQTKQAEPQTKQVEPQTKQVEPQTKPEPQTEGLSKLKSLAKKLKKDDTGKELVIKPQEVRGEDLAKSIFNSDSDKQSGYDKRTFEEFIDERILVSRDLFGKKEMKVKILEVSDEQQQSKIRWKFGDRVKVDKIIVTVKHLDSMNVEEGEFDIAAIEKELAEKRHYSSTNRWIPAGDIKNGYVINSKHTALISDAVALDYITF